MRWGRSSAVATASAGVDSSAEAGGMTMTGAGVATVVTGAAETGAAETAAAETAAAAVTVSAA